MALNTVAPALREVRRQLERSLGPEHCAIRRAPFGSILFTSPADVEQAQSVVATAHAAGLRVWPCGSATRADSWQGTEEPEAVDEADSISWRPDIVLSVRRLNRMLDHQPENLVLRAESGLRIADLVDGLAARGQRLPVEPRTASTLGGLAARNEHGGTRLRFGTLRDWVIGATAIRADGELVQSGGMVVKNVSGFDLAKLHLGAHGSLGVLVRLNLKLAPLPRTSAAPRVALPNRGEALAVLASLRTHSIEPVRADWSASSKGTGALHLQLEGAKETVETALACLHGWREEPSGPAHEFRPTLAVRLHHRPSRAEELLASFDALHARLLPGSRWAEETSLASGVSRFGFDVDHGTQAEPAIELVETMRERVRVEGGWLLVTECPASLRARIERTGITPDARRAVLDLKTALDPAGTFPPPPLDWNAFEASR